MSSPSVVSGLQQAVANTYTLTLLTQSVHWNVIGPDFFQLHSALGTQYEALFDTVDLLAERIRALGDMVEASLSGFESRAAMPVISPSFSAKGMVAALVAAHEKNVGDLKTLAADARGTGDTVTENMVLILIESEQKTLWMLKSYLK